MDKRTDRRACLLQQTSIQRSIWGFFAPQLQQRHVAPMSVKFGTVGRLFYAKFHPHWCKGGLWDPENGKFYELWGCTNAPHGRVSCAILAKFSGFLSSSTTDLYSKFGEIRWKSLTSGVRFPRNFQRPLTLKLYVVGLPEYVQFLAHPVYYLFIKRFC